MSPDGPPLLPVRSNGVHSPRAGTEATGMAETGAVGIGMAAIGTGIGITGTWNNWNGNWHYNHGYNDVISSVVSALHGGVRAGISLLGLPWLWLSVRLLRRLWQPIRLSHPVER